MASCDAGQTHRHASRTGTSEGDTQADATESALRRGLRSGAVWLVLLALVGLGVAAHNLMGGVASGPSSAASDTVTEVHRSEPQPPTRVGGTSGNGAGGAAHGHSSSSSRPQRDAMPSLADASLHPQFVDAGSGGVVVDAYTDPTTGEVSALVLVSKDVVAVDKQHLPTIEAQCVVSIAGSSAPTTTAADAAPPGTVWESGIVTAEHAGARDGELNDQYHSVIVWCGAVDGLVRRPHQGSSTAAAVPPASLTLQWRVVAAASSLAAQQEPDAAWAEVAARVPLRLLPTPDDTTSVTHSICLAPLFGSVVSSEQHADEFLEWIEWHRLLGVGRVHAYMTRNAYNSTLSPALDCYTRRHGGMLRLHDWRSVAAYPQWYHGQVPAMHDCLFRSRRDSEFVMYIDRDEYMAPGVTSMAAVAPLIKFSPQATAAASAAGRNDTARGLSALLALVEAADADAFAAASGFAFTSWHYCAPGDAGIAAGRRTFLASRVERCTSPQCNAEDPRPKNIYKAAQAHTLSIHYPDRLDGALVEVDPEVMRANHYSYLCGNRGTDDGLARFDAALAEAVAEAKAECGLP